MARGRKAKVGDTRIAANGYHYTKTKAGWELTHRLTAERKLGRKLADNERVRFVDGDRTNYTDPNNIEVYEVRKGSVAKRKAQLEARKEAIDAELAELEELERESA